MNTSILREAASLLPGLYGAEWGNLRVTGLWLQELYTVVELSNGQVDVALNYDNEGFIQYRRHYDPVATAQGLLAETVTDPLLLETLLGRASPTLCELSALCAILGALSRPFLKPTHLGQLGYIVTDGSISLDSIARNDDTIHIVGFGGYLEQALASSKFSQVFVSDLSYGLSEGKEMIDRELENYQRIMRARSLCVYDGRDSTDYLQKSDIVIITGSALCNGTMEGLLEAAGNAREVIVYGHSGTLLPSVYCRRNVTRLCWSVLPPTFLERFKARLEHQNAPDSFADFIDSELSTSFTIHSPQTGLAMSPTGCAQPQLRQLHPRSNTSHRMVSFKMLETAAEYHARGRLDWAQYHYSRALEIAACSGDLRTAAECSYRLGLIHLEEGRENHGREWLERSLELYTELGEINRQADILLRLGRSPLMESPTLSPGKELRPREAPLTPIPLSRPSNEPCITTRRNRDAWHSLDHGRNVYSVRLSTSGRKRGQVASPLPGPSGDPLEVFRKGVESYALYFQPTGELHDPVFDEPTQYGTAYYALCNAILATMVEGKLRGVYLDRAMRGLEAAINHVSDLDQPSTASGFRRDTGDVYRFNHRDFFWPPVMKTYRLLKGSRTACAERFTRQITNVDIEKVFNDRPPSNVAAVWLSGEWLRFCEGLSPYTMEQFDRWLERLFVERILIDQGMYQEPGYPNSYDLFVRYHLLDMLLEGYRGQWHEAFEQLLLTGLQRSLDLQLSDGSLASAHRSTGQTWTLGAQCAFFTRAAGYFRDRNSCLSEQARHAAQQAFYAMRRWQRLNGPYSPVENCLPPAFRVGYEVYTADGHYGPLALSYLGVAILEGFDRLTEESLAPCPPTVRIEHDPTYRAIVRHGHYSLHVNACPAPDYDGFGIVDLTFGPRRYLHFASSVRHVETGRLFNLGLGHRDSPERSGLTVMAQQDMALIGTIKKHDAPASLHMHARPKGCPYIYSLSAVVHEDGVQVTEGTPGLSNFKTLLIPYLRDPGTGPLTQVHIAHGKVNLVYSSEEICIAFDQSTHQVLHFPHGYENRRGLCGLVRVDFLDPCEEVGYRITVVR